MPVSLFVRILLWLWFGGAIAASQFNLLQRLPAAAIPAATVAPAVLVILACYRLPALRAWTQSIDLRALVLLHVTRFVGIYFLILFQRGDLPRAFAVPTGLGDIVVATMAIPVALAPLEAAPRQRAIAIWNVVGFVSLLLALVNATRVSLADPVALRALTHLPLSLISTFLMPLLLVTHVILFSRTART
jgi:hypothetical protein